MLSSKQKKKLRALAQTQKAVMQIGKDGISENSIQTLDDALEAHELVKVSMLKTCVLSVEEAIELLEYGTNSELVQQIGRTMVFYRRSKKPKLEL